MSQNGKGSRTRPKSVDQKTWEKNYDRIFGKKISKTTKKNS
jgi:hypothetical protein